MSTQQRYGGKGNYAPPASQTVNSDQQTQSAADSRQNIKDPLFWTTELEIDFTALTKDAQSSQARIIFNALYVYQNSLLSDLISLCAKLKGQHSYSQQQIEGILVGEFSRTLSEIRTCTSTMDLIGDSALLNSQIAAQQLTQTGNSAL